MQPLLYITCCVVSHVNLLHLVGEVVAGGVAWDLFFFVMIYFIQILTGLPH